MRHRIPCSQSAPNAIAIINAAQAGDRQFAAVAVFPELCLSGYAIEDLVMQDSFLDAVERGLLSVVAASAGLMTVLIIGAPLRTMRACIIAPSWCIAAEF